MIRKNTSLLFGILFIFQTNISAQNCLTLGGPFTFGIPCGATCTNISFKVPQIKSSEDYSLKNIGYNPQTYVTATGNEITSVYIDDQYSTTLNLPFNVCMYGQTFNQFIVGSNGVMAFDLALSGCKNGYSVPNDIPFEGTGSCTSIAGPRYPKFSIMSPYHDIDPSELAASPNRKIEWRIEGVAPCRKLVVSFFQIPMFSCTSLIATSQIVVYENSALIDIHVGNKPLCSSWQSGRAILGIQKDATKALAVPGHNATDPAWSETNKGYRFTPNGLTNLLQSVTITKKDGTPVGTGTIGATANDSTTITYNNYCLTGTGPDTLVVKANYNSCTGVATDAFSYVDTIYVIKSPADLLATHTTTPAFCLSSNGSLTVNVPPGAGTSPFQYSLNGAPYVSTNTFTGLASGTYTVYVQDNSTACKDTLTISVPFSNPVTVTGVATAPTCAGAANGSLTITALNVIAPITYSINGGTPQASNTFNGLIAGTYNVLINDGNGCNKSVFVTVPAGVGGITATLSITPTTCPGAINGSITVTNPSGTAPHEYAIGATGTFGASNVFTNLTSGIYLIKVKDANGCTTSFNANVTNGTGISASSSIIATSCVGINNGSISVNAANGATPYQYALNGGGNQGSNLFSNLAAGIYSIKVTDANGCNVTINATVATGAGVNASFSTVSTTCVGVNNGSVTVTPTSGTAPYSYSLNSGTPQPISTFTGLSAGLHSVLVTDINGCNKNLTISIGAGVGLIATSSTTATTCSAVSNGTITITPTNGTAPYTYSLDGGTAQTTNTFNGVSSGPHTILITDFNNCTRTLNITVTAGTVFTLSQTNTTATCAVALNGTATIGNIGGTLPFAYSVDGGTSQSSNILSNLSVGPHSVLVTDGAGCNNTINFNITAGAGLSVIGTPTMPTCNGLSNGQVAALVSGSATLPIQYQVGASALQTSNIFNGLAAGSYPINVIDGAGCTATNNVTIAQPTVLNASVVAAPVLCNGQSNGIITVTATGGTTPYNYSIDNGSSYQPANTFNRPAGNYSIIVKDANGCLKNVNVTITEPNIIIVTTTPTAASCNGGADGTILVNATGGTGTYTYSIDGTNFQPSATFNVLQGNYTITVKDINGCTNTANTIVGLSSNILVDARVDTTICESKNVTLTTNSNATSFSWTPAIGLNSTTVQNPIATPLVTTKYYVTATLGNCSKQDSVTVIVNPAPVPDAGPGITICFGKSYTLQGSGGVSYTWANANTLANTSSSTPIATPSTTTTYTLSNVIDANGCISLTTDTVTVIVTPPIIANAGRDTVIVMGQPYQLNATGATLFSWSPAFGLSNPTIANPIATIFASQIYTVEVSTPEGCKGFANVKLEVLKGPDIYVPTAFTPNGDGINDVFKVFPVGIKQFNYLRIFNRWGQKIFETQNDKIGWDAIFHSIKQPTGAYIYTVEGVTDAGKVITKKGTLIIAR